MEQPYEEPSDNQTTPVPTLPPAQIFCARCYHSLCIPIPADDSDADSGGEEEEDSGGGGEEEEEEDSVSPIFQEDPADVEERILEEIDEYLMSNPLILSHSNVEKEVTAAVSNALIEEWSDNDLCEDDEFDAQEIKEWIRTMVDVYLNGQSVMPPRQGGNANTMTPLRRASIARKLRLLDSIVTPAQRTQEWYETRYNLITASNLAKALGTESQQNQLIMEKCQSFEQFKEDCARQSGGPQIGSENPMAWGQKYEPVTATIYERRNKTRLGEYGCIAHPDWAFLGASPDGINTDPESPIYGRMVEIKNIVNREITGVPLDQYWVQMQVQMEVCDLDECDFVETRFKEFASKEAFLASANPCRGVILGFSPHYIPGQTAATPRLASFYKYHVLDEDAADYDKMDAWIKSTKEEHTREYVLAAVAYWELDQYSCVLVKRNRVWFEAAIKRVEAIWRTIEQERVTGCQHRAPKKRAPKTTDGSSNTNAHIVMINKLDGSEDSTLNPGVV